MATADCLRQVREPHRRHRAAAGPRRDRRAGSDRCGDLPPADWNDGGTSPRRARGSTTYSPAARHRAAVEAGASVDDAGSARSPASMTSPSSRPATNEASAAHDNARRNAVRERPPHADRATTPPKSFGDTVVISWNRSTEQRAPTRTPCRCSRCQDRHRPHDEGITGPGPSGEQCCDWLAGNGINAREHDAGLNGRRPGDALMEEATKLGADLIIKAPIAEPTAAHDFRRRERATFSRTRRSRC